MKERPQNRRHFLRAARLTYSRYEADFVELAAAVRGERSLSLSLADELLIHETVLKAGDRP